MIRTIVKALIPSTVRKRIRAGERWLKYAGIRYSCPFCRAHLRRFAPFGLAYPVLTEKQVVGGGWRDNALCPRCGSFDRERLLWLYLINKTDLFQGQKQLLHIAPEHHLSRRLRGGDRLHYWSADISEGDVSLRLDLTRIPFPDDSFDVILCNHVLEHIADDTLAMSELYRVLKPGGWAVLQVPVGLALEETFEDPLVVDPDRRAEIFGQEDHVRIYGLDYPDRLEQAGFIVSVFDWETEAVNFGGTRNRFGLNERECLYRVDKPGR